MPYFFSSGNFTVIVYSEFHQEVKEAISLLKISDDVAAYLEFVQDSKPADLSFRYLIIKDSESRPSAFMYVQIQTFSGKNIQVTNPFLAVIKNMVLTLRPFKIMVCGNLFAVNFPCIKYNGDLITIDQLVSVVGDLEKKENPDVTVIKDLPAEFTRSLMSRYSFTSFDGDLTMELSIHPEWKTMNDYYNSLSKKYLKRAKKLRENFREVRVAEFSLEDILKHNRRINELFRNVASKQLVRMGVIGENYFSEFKKRFPGRFSFVGYFKEEKLIAFSTYIDHNEELEVHYIGIDYNYNTEYHLYFNMLFDSTERAIRENKKTLELGRTAREAKANLGCKPVYFNDYTRIKSAFTKKIVSFFENRFGNEMGEGWKNRHPFKK